MIKGMRKSSMMMTKAKADLDKNGGLKQGDLCSLRRLFRIFLSARFY